MPPRGANLAPESKDTTAILKAIRPRQVPAKCALIWQQRKASTEYQSDDRKRHQTKDSRCRRCRLRRAARYDEGLRCDTLHARRRRARSEERRVGKEGR